jgi:hypothetical protein
VSIRYRATSSGPDSQRQNHARRDRSVPPLPVDRSFFLTALVESTGAAGTAIVTGIALVAALASPIVAKGRGQVDITSFLTSTPTLGQAVARGRASEAAGTYTLTGSLSSVPAKGRGKVAETGFGVTPTLGTVTAKGRAYIQQGGGYDIGFSIGYTSGIASYAVLGVVSARGEATTLPTGQSVTGVLGNVGAIGGSGNSGRGIVSGQFVIPTLAGTATGFSTGFSVGYGSTGFVPAALGKGRALTDVVGLNQFGFLGIVSGIGLGEVTWVPPFTAVLRMVPVLEGAPRAYAALDAEPWTNPTLDADLGIQPVFEGELEMTPVLDGGHVEVDG